MTAQQIINDVAVFYGITPDQLIHGDRCRRFSEPRHVAAYLMRSVLKMTFSTIGDTLGGRRYSTVMHSVRLAGGWVKIPVLNRKAATIINELTTNRKGGEDVK